MRRLQKLSRRETALAVAALLLPVPLFAQSGLSVPLPGAVEQGLGSLITLDSDNGAASSDYKTKASDLTVSESGAAATQGKRSGRESIAITRDGDETTASESGDAAAAESGQGGSDETAGDGGGTPTGGDPGGADDDAAGSPGDPSGSANEPSGGSSGAGGGSAGSGSGPSLLVTGTGQGGSVGAGADDGGIRIDTAASEDGAGSGDTQAGVEITGVEGAPSGTSVTVPTGGIGLP